MKKYLFFAAAALTLAGCASDDYIGEGLPGGESAKKAQIAFSSTSPLMQRAVKTGKEAAADLNNEIYVYGTKKVENVDCNVFAAGKIGDNNAPYKVWFVENSQSSSNTAGWEYVGTNAESQTIKYWDYAASQYDFVAYSLNDGTVSNVSLSGFTFNGTPAQLQALKVADKKKVEKGNFKSVVTFTFRSAGAKARIGIYETVPGYDIKNVQFRYTDASGVAQKGAKAILNGNFLGGKDAFDSQVTFDSQTGRALITQSSSSLTPVTVMDFGALNYNVSNELGISAGEATFTGYTNVIPNSSNLGKMTLLVDYTLVNDATGEEIHVKGASAEVPQNYMEWKNNYAYTYLFKITDKTNGTTGTEVTNDPAGLFPITFDAQLETEIDAGSQTTESEVNGTENVTVPNP